MLEYVRDASIRPTRGVSGAGELPGFITVRAHSKEFFELSSCFKNTQSGREIKSTIFLLACSRRSFSTSLGSTAETLEAISTTPHRFSRSV